MNGQVRFLLTKQFSNLLPYNLPAPDRAEGFQKMMKKRHDEILEILSSLLVIAVCLSSCLKIEKVVDGASKEVALSPVASVMTKQIPGPVLGTTYSEKLYI